MQTRQCLYPLCYDLGKYPQAHSWKACFPGWGPISRRDLWEDLWLVVPLRKGCRIPFSQSLCFPTPEGWSALTHTPHRYHWLLSPTPRPPTLPGTPRVRTKYKLVHKLLALGISLSNAKLTPMCSLGWERQAWARASALSSHTMPQVRDGVRRPLPAADTTPDFSFSRRTSEKNPYSLYAPSLWKFCYDDRP